MGAFLEQYGIAIFVLVIIAIMVLMASGLGDYIEKLLVKEISDAAEVGQTQAGNATGSTPDAFPSVN